MKKTILFTTTVLLTAAIIFLSDQETFQDDYLIWKQKFGHSWSPEEDTYRKIIYNKNIEIIQRHNSNSSKSYTMGVNQFTALTDA